MVRRESEKKGLITLEDLWVAMAANNAAIANPGYKLGEEIRISETV